MKKIFMLFAVGFMLTSCNFKDNSGNAPLIKDENGYLIDNPAYVDPAKEKEDAQREKDVKRISEGMKAWADSAVAADKNNK